MKTITLFFPDMVKIRILHPDADVKTKEIVLTGEQIYDAIKRGYI